VSIRKLVGTVPADDTLPGRLTAHELLTWKGLINGLSPQETAARVRRVLTVIGLEEVAERPIHSYTPGMRTRTAMAVALMSEADPLAAEALLLAEVA
jgi:ABC-2 type transport system ATP-binding protein